MQINETSNKGLKRVYEITLSEKKLAEKAQGKVEELQKKMKLPGFRAGKIPVSYINQRFGKQVREENVNELINEACQNLIKDRKLKLADKPKLEKKEDKEAEGVSFEFSCELLPEVPKELIDFSKIKLTNYKIKSEQGDFDKVLEIEAKQDKELKEILNEKTKIVQGNMVNISYKGFIEDKQFEGGTADNHDLEIGSKSFIDNFEDQLVGLKKGDEKTIKVKFPAEYHNEEFKGKKAKFEVKINKISEIIPAIIDDEFAKKKGAKNLEEYKKGISDLVKKSHQDQVNNQLKKDLFDYLDDKVKLDLPESTVDQEYKMIMDQYYTDHKYKDEENAEKNDKNFKKTKKDNLALAKRRVKIGILIAEIAQMNDILVSEDEAIKSLQEQLAQYPENMHEQLLSYYKSNPNAIEYLKSPILEKKVIDFMKTKIILKDKELTLEQFNKINNKQ